MRNRILVKTDIMFLVFAALMSCKKKTEEELVPLTDEEKSDLLFLREEEKLARDVYLYAYDKYGLMQFGNIVSSEQMHMDAVKDLLDKYGLEDPASPNRGEFSNAVLQQLYADLTALVDSSQTQALYVGATIEDLDINDIREMKTRTEKDDLLNVYNLLECGSRNHMRAYYNALLSAGVVYQAQYITPEELDEIINSPHERCGG